MGEQRRVALRGTSWVVPVPRVVRRHLGILRGGDLYWHVGPKGEAFVTISDRRIGGKPPGARVARDLTAALSHIERLEHRLAARPTAVYNEGVNEGRTRHLGELIKLGVQLDTLTAEVRALAERLPFTRRTRSARGARARSVDVIPTPVLSSPAVPTYGGADTSGAEPPGVPLSAE